MHAVENAEQEPVVLKTLPLPLSNDAVHDLKIRRDLLLHELELPGELSPEAKEESIRTEEERSETSKSSDPEPAGGDGPRSVSDVDVADLQEDDLDDDKGLGVMKRAWAPEEDQRLLELVEEFGPRRWSVIANNLQGRVGKQCRERCAPPARTRSAARRWKRAASRSVRGCTHRLPCLRAAGTTTCARRSTRRSGPRRRTS